MRHLLREVDVHKGAGARREGGCPFRWTDRESYVHGNAGLLVAETTRRDVTRPDHAAVSRSYMAAGNRRRHQSSTWNLNSSSPAITATR